MDQRGAYPLRPEDSRTFSKEEVDGILTGKLSGKNCRGGEKASRVQNWCEGAGMSADDLVYAYGDSSGDVQLLELFSHPTWVSKVDLQVSAS